MEVENNIPLPSKTQGARSVYIEHLRKLSVGQSMFFPDSEFSAKIEQLGIGIRVAAGREWGRGTFVTRTMKDPERGLGVRVWRIG